MIHNQLKKNIIWDLSGTLLKSSSEHLTTQEAADSSLLFYLWSGKKKPSPLDTIALTVMNQLGKQNEQNSTIIRNPAGEPLPEIVCFFLAGKLSSGDASHKALTFFDKWTQKNQTHSSEQLSQARRIIETFFDPYCLARCFIMIPGLVEILKQTSHAQKTVNYIISNWDKESFDLIYKKYQDPIFSYFKLNHILISAEAGYVKPHEEIFNYFLDTQKITPESCFFIDDQKDNITTAARLGIEGIQFNADETELVAIKLRELNVL
ncbi:HAD-IA family hydrolase [Candidatus Dependentiae bacterium]|nr:HAD-IA family hydrolase [Candidatus Dependentiae bacterium]